ncbi:MULTISPECIES: sugar phosphate isomerase/epimerase [unclassified Lentimonas]|uniref:sugar phosphate isomerase/epimerase family protein n=1 Tax=unclassified Lentimonas TaxID=2630993 RepID=UPI001321E491|nr:MULTISPECIES: sugar phosphate isomerase/epimerase family protein [unclassified Lentimonas]CAA6692382.1 Unannotated [Lentimonas sp. CC19]CAA6693948.1 Unannotated [Lentimonas sp. CC10]CAA7072201.1 Unannotated [Lentimonas sp. CC11]
MNFFKTVLANWRHAAAIGHLLIAATLLGQSHALAESEFKVGTCDWTLRMGADVEAFYFAERVGLKGIQFTFGAAGEGLDLRTRANRDLFRQTIKRTGVACSSLGIGRLNKIPLASTDEGEQLVVDCIAAMALLQTESAEFNDPDFAARVSPQIVLLAFFNKGDINGQPALIESVITKLKRLAPMAESHGLTLGLETRLCEADHRYILESVDSPALKVFYDVANSASMGYDIYAELESLGTDNICQIHLKEMKALLGNGSIDFPRIKGILKTMDYQGWLILEGATPKGMDRLEASKANATYALELFGR